MEKRRMMYAQRTLNFETPANAEVQHVAESTSQPPPADQGKKTTPLVRPERQLTYGGAHHWEWPDPAPLHDRDTITVDRIRDDIDGPSHRFIIKRFDEVEVYFSAKKIEVGEVIGISHAKGEVSVLFPGAKNGIWFYKGHIFPTGELTGYRPPHDSPRLEVLATVNSEPTAEPVAEAAAPVVVPFTFDEFRNFCVEFGKGTVPFATYREQFERIWESQEGLRSELITRFNAKQLAVLAARFGSWDSRRSTKEQNANHVVSKMLAFFMLERTVCYRPTLETYESVIRRNVLAVTEAEYVRELEKRKEAKLADKKALTSPETFYEFRTFINAKGEEALSDEQLARYDALHADMTRERRQQEAPAHVEQFQSDELQDHRFQRKQGFHDKRQCPLYIVQLESRVERTTFNELNRKAKMLGGWYSSFKKDSAGFQFLDESQADRFCSLLSANVDRSDVLESRRERKEQSAAERLQQLATEMRRRAEETIEQSNHALQNTARRADIQAGVRGRAYAEQALSRTLDSIAEALRRGEAKYLDGLRHKTHVETLESVLHLAKWARIRALKKQQGETSYQLVRRQDALQEQPIGLETVRFVEYPFPYCSKRNLLDLATQARTTKGLKLVAERLGKRLAREKDDYIRFSAEHEVELLCDFVDRLKVAGIDAERIASSLAYFQRLKRANIHDIHELRVALREYLPHRGQARGDDPVRVAERELIGKDLPGFFPTPRSVIDRMLELAQIECHHRVLEPSCGKGDILDAIKDDHPDIQPHAIEKNYTLSDVLAAKGHAVEFGDFLEHRGMYDRIVMNPPFENGQDIDHVRHAYSLLQPGGLVVAVMSTGPFFREDTKAKSFRTWLEDVDAAVEWLPDDAFKGREAFRQTGVRTRLVTITK